MRWLVVGAIGAIGLSGQTPPATDDRIVVFPAEQATTLVTQCSRQVPGPVQGTWLPDASTVAKVERGLEPAFVQALDKAEAPEKSRHPIREYYRQYGGLVVDGRRVVYLNGFHQLHLEWPTKLRPPRAPIDWRHLAVNVCDGWVIYFGATFDVTSGKIESLVFNGRAGPTNTALQQTSGGLVAPRVRHRREGQ